LLLEKAVPTVGWLLDELVHASQKAANEGTKRNVASISDRLGGIIFKESILSKILKYWGGAIGAPRLAKFATYCKRREDVELGELRADHGWE